MEDMYDYVLKIDKDPAVARPALDMVCEDIAFVLEYIFDFVCESLDLCRRVTAADYEIICESGLTRNINGLDIDALL